jgi:EAL domain-containing protein (putative c-di-GMP-specific phosphodiesterase class I)
MLERLHELGAGICLQGFGTGHSSLSQLQRLKIDMIKIDRLMTRPNAKGARPVILRSLISLAHDLGVQVIADGTESEADTIDLGQMGCEYAQGYAFGNPISSSEARRLVGAANEAA